MTQTETNRAKIVAAVIGGIILLFIVVAEIILSTTSRPEATFSNILRAWAIVGLAAPFGWGTLAGHFFHPVADLKPLLHEYVDAYWNLIIAVTPIVVLAILDTILALVTDGVIYPSWVSPIALTAGCLWGTFMWPVQGEEA